MGGGKKLLRGNSPSKGKVRFVGGTGTEVGKTVFCAVLLAKLCREGKKVVWFKPVETGVTETPADWLFITKFCEFLKRQGDFKLKIERPLYTFPEPISPHIASERAKRKIDIDRILHKIKKLSENFDEVVVEGAGGMLTPLKISEGSTVKAAGMKEKRRESTLQETLPVFTWADLCVKLGKELPTSLILVSANYLGTLTHTIATVESCVLRGLEITGIVLNQTKRRKKDLATVLNPHDFERIFGKKYLGLIPYFSGYDAMWRFVERWEVELN